MTTVVGTRLAFWGVVAATGMGALLQSSAYALSVVKVLGAAYLLYLAVQSARAAIRGQDGAENITGFPVGPEKNVVG